MVRAIRWYIEHISFFGDGVWLTTIQAYSLKEEEQLFLLNITSS
jgi:hypothetical protein